MAAPGTYTMLREDDPRVQSFHSEPPPAACLLGPGTTSYAVFAPKVQTGKLPVVLFQTGHGSGIASDKPFLERLAAEGFFVIAPDRFDDLRCGLCGLVGFLSGCLCSANAVDGSALKAALEFAKSPANTWRDRADLNQVAMAGFSMGAQEALAAQARLPSETKALLLISPSLMPLANFLGWNPLCITCSGGSCCLCSDSPLKPCGLMEALRESKAPTLLLTAEYDLTNAAAYRAADNLGARGTVVTLKEASLDLGIPHTKATTSWGTIAALGCCAASPFFGVPRHFGITEDAGGVASGVLAAFLKQHLKGGPPMAGTDTMVGGEINTRAALSCLSPFPLFKSCFDN